MPAFTFTSPEGKKYTVNGPEGATQEQAFQILQGQIGGQKATPQGKTWDEDVLPSLSEGLSRGVESLIGLPGDVWHGARFLANKLIGSNQPINDILPTSENLRARREAFAGAGYEPQTTVGEYARTIGEFVPGAMFAPERNVGLAALKYGVAPGVASETAGQLTKGTPVEPYARLAGAAAGAFSPALADVGARAGRRFLEPFSETGRENVAARGFREAFTDPRQAQIELEAAKALQQPGAGLGEIVPGSRPTTGQLTGDPGALQLERALANENRTLYHENPYGTGADQQNAARAAALAGIQPGGVPADVSQAIRRGLANIETAHDAAIQSSLGNAQAAASGVGQGMTPEAQGAALRSALQSGRDAAKANERRLWAAIDPDGTLSMPAGPVTSVAAEIANAIPRTARPMSGEEAAIFETARGLPSVSPFNEMTALRSRISTAMREELRSAGQSPTYARLTQLRGAVENAIENAAVHKGVLDDAAVAAGEMNPADTLGARIGGILGESGPASGQDAGTGIAQARTSRAPGGAPASGAGGQGTGRPGNYPGDQGIPGNVARNRAAQDVGKVYYPSGSIDVRPEVVNLPDLITSHDTNFRVNRAYPQELQPRSRENAPARDQVNIIAARLQPERLGPSPEANSGAPIVGPDNVVESGNGRTLALAKAYQSGRGETYRQWLQSQGFDTSGVPFPVLVSRRQTPMSESERAAFAHSANTASGLRMNAVEQAMADAKLITPGALEAVADGSAINSEQNRSFVRSFLSQMPASERGGMMDAQGNLSQSGIRRIEAAMAARAYGDADFVARAFDAADPNIRGLAGALNDAAGAWMKMRQAAREGAIDPEHDVTPDLMRAARAIIRARDAGRPVAEVLNQSDMFGGEASALAKSLILNERGQVASREQIAGRLRRYAGEAVKNLSSPSIFGDVVRPADVLRTALRNEGVTVEPEMQSAALKSGPQANTDAAAAERLKAASAATRERAQTFDRGPVGDVLRKSGASDYRLPDSAVPGRMWTAGPRGAETARAYLAAAGSPDALIDAAMESLREKAMTAEDIIDPRKFAAWKERYGNAIRALPGEVEARFSTAASASRAYEDAAIARKAAVDAYQTGVAGKFLGLSSGSDVTRTVGAIFGARDATARMRDLVDRLKGNAEAMEGLKKSIADHISALATSTTEAGASGLNKVNASSFQKFVAKNAGVLRTAGFSEAQISTMRALANDLQRSQRTMQATALPASPNTAADVMGAMRSAAKEARGPSLLSKVLGGSWAGLHVGGPYGALTGAAGAIGEHLARALRGAGLAKARDIIQEGILNPEVGRRLLQRAASLPDEAAEKALAQALRKRAIFATPGVSAANDRTQGSIEYGVRQLSVVLPAEEVRQAVRQSPALRSSLDKFVKAATALRGSRNPQNISRFMLAAKNLSSNLQDSGIDATPEALAGAIGGGK